MSGSAGSEDIIHKKDMFSLQVSYKTVKGPVHIFPALPAV